MRGWYCLVRNSSGFELSLDASLPERLDFSRADKHVPPRHVRFIQHVTLPV